MAEVKDGERRSAKRKSKRSHSSQDHKAWKCPRLDAFGASKLLLLPAELRNRIYEHALVAEDAIFVFTAKRIKYEDTIVTHPIREPVFLSTCRQIRDEATPIYYRSNSFITTIHSELAAWLKVIGKEKRAMLTSVHDHALYRMHGLQTALLDLETAEHDLLKAGVPLRKDVLKLHVNDREGGSWLNESGTKAIMEEKDWAAYRYMTRGHCNPRALKWLV